MKLYATTTGEKLQNGQYTYARKGQGSNTQLNIFINIDDDKSPRFQIFINKRDDDSTDFVIIDALKPFPNDEIYREKIKGKKKKGDHVCYCNDTDLSVPHMHSDH